MTIRPSLIGALAALSLIVPSISSAQVTSEPVYSDIHKIDVREFAASLQWEEPNATDAIRTRRSPADNGYRWIDRIHNLPDYMRNYYDNHVNKVNQVLAGGSNCLSDYTKGTRFIEEWDSAYVVMLHEFNYKVEYTFPQDINPRDANAKQPFAEQAFLAEVDKLYDEINAFTPYMFMSMSYDCPQAFWIGNYYLWATAGNYSWHFSTAPGVDQVQVIFQVYIFIRNSTFDFRIESFQTPDEIEIGAMEYDNLVYDILENVPATGRYDQIRYFNDWLTKHNSYSSAFNTGDFSPIVWSPMSALRGTTGPKGPVCEGYARAFKILCDAVDIPCILAVGDAKGSLWGSAESHMWNEVMMEDNNWYAVDVTWNDPMTGMPNEPEESGYENEDWLLLGTDDIVNYNLTFAQSHPNSLIYGQDEMEHWDYDGGTLISAHKYDPSTGIRHTWMDSSYTVYSLSGQKLGKFATLQEARSTLSPGLYIINNRQLLIK